MEGLREMLKRKGVQVGLGSAAVTGILWAAGAIETSEATSRFVSALLAALGAG